MRRWLLSAVFAVAATALAQVDLVDPDVKPKTVRKPARPAPAPRPGIEGEGDLGEQPIDLKPGESPEIDSPDTEEEEAKPVAPVKAPVKVAPKKVEPVPFGPSPRPPVPAILPTKLTDADLDAAWDRWRVANQNQASDPKAEAAARADLVRLKNEIGASDLEPWSIAMLRAAEAHEAAGASSTAVELALSAVELAPNLPAPQFGLARAYFAADPSEVPRYFGTVKAGVMRLIFDPRYNRPLLGDVATALLFALALTGVLVLIVLLARRVRYFLYDLHFFFPRAVPRWQSAAIGLLLLSLPLVFRLGLVPSLLVAFAAVTLYLSFAERVVVTVLIGCIGCLPLLGQLLVRYTAFADTPAEQAWQLERGGTGTAAIAQEVATRAAEDKAGFGELFALGTYELHRGKLDLAIPRLEAALLKKPNEPRAQLNLAAAMMMTGDLENPAPLLKAAADALPDSPAPHWNLARYHQRRVATLGIEGAATEVDEGNRQLGEARARDPSLTDRKDPPNDKLYGNLYLMTVPMAHSDLVALTASPEAEARVRSQLTLMLLGDWNAPYAPFYPLGACLVLMAFGALSTRLQAARACSKCGTPMSRREDPEVGLGSGLCTACVNVFSKKGVVPPALKVRKQVEVARYQSRMDRAAFGLGLVCSGMGHVFRGLPVRGTLYAFLFLFAGVAFFLRDGVMRSPFEGLPAWLKILPLAVLFLGVYALSLRALFKKQGA